MDAPRELETFEPRIVMNSLETTSVGRSRVPSSGEGVPPTSPWPLTPSKMAGQITEWKTMLSLPMK